MVSVVEGAMPLSDLDDDSGTLGWDVLKKCLPPGEYSSFYSVLSV
jgi:hypothetical protein